MKQKAEFLICWSFALICAVRGGAALWTDSYWLASKTSAPVHYVGAKARWLGAGEIGVALAFLGVWLVFSLGRRLFGFGAGLIG